ncbi:hypothetical protein [Desulfuromusa kysingii]|nr:hypothetical protein [Desulfuromusa kysingii]
MRHRKPHRIQYLFKLLMILIVLLLCGCVSNSYWTWQHPNMLDEMQLQEDRKECWDLAKAEVDSINYYYDYARYNVRYYWPYNRHNHHKGKVKSFDPYFNNYSHYKFFQRQDDLDRFFRICMKTKGWQRVKVERIEKQPAQ